ncbi:hypothetical protein LZQ00_02990 [Sphingobacterium sp. SRCM116780]|uniref:hypothetical protein n=1 Tax=Sphingobacterium sp. SRCM116780 TaxID=2907623 RepID=UPI001F1DC6CD|nr:hypothetical protein [Sphingobacterium sp. SRCM116780]UIR56790.1 hypothetical protein LZQ00_02990 [Sphingobacterium sp. SRCM116780]
MKKGLSMLIACLILISCRFKESKNIKETKVVTPEVRSEKVDKNEKQTLEIGYFDTYEKLPKFKIDSVDQSEYYKLKATKDFEQSNVEKVDEFFYIQTSSSKLKYKEYNENTAPERLNGNEYLGFNNRLKLFAIQSNSVSEGLGFAELILIDSITNYQYRIISLGDWSVSLPKLSPNNKFMVYYQNPEYESETLSIAVLKVNETDRYHHFFKEYASCMVQNKLSIEEIRWKDDQTFYVKAYKSTIDAAGHEVKLFNYFVAIIN